MSLSEILLLVLALTCVIPICIVAMGVILVHTGFLDWNHDDSD